MQHICEKPNELYYKEVHRLYLMFQFIMVNVVTRKAPIWSGHTLLDVPKLFLCLILCTRV